jgi:hypothetical protein
MGVVGRPPCTGGGADCIGPVAGGGAALVSPANGIVPSDSLMSKPFSKQQIPN